MADIWKRGSLLQVATTNDLNLTANKNQKKKKKKTDEL